MTRRTLPQSQSDLLFLPRVMTFLVHFAEFSRWLEVRVSGQDKQRKIHADGLVVRLPRRVHEGAIPV